MKNTILIRRNELQQQIDLRNYYMGDAAKRKELDAVSIQSSKDDEQLLYMFISKACNELVTAVALRFPYISANINADNVEISFETRHDFPQHLLPLLQQSINDYIVNEAITQWLLVRRPEMAHSNIAARANLYYNVQHTFAKIYNRQKIRRRSTDLAGI